MTSENNMIPIDENIDVFDRKNCKLCQSKNREEAEMAYEDGKSIKAIQNLLSAKGEKISYPAVRNHLIYHYVAQQKNLRLTEYAKDLKKWMENELDRESEIKARIGMLRRQMYLIASETEGSSLEEQRKSADTIKKLMEALMACEEKLDEKNSDMQPVEIVIRNLNDLVNVEIKTAKTDETKKVLGTLLDKLAKSVDSIMLDRKK